MRQGSWGKISGDEYLTPHGLWLSLYSGANKAEHGFYYYRQLRPSSYKMAPYDVKDATADPFWYTAGSGGARIAVLDVPEAYPISGLGGCQLANFRIHNSPGEPVSEPSTFLQTALELCGERQVVQEKANATLDQDRQLYGRLLSRIRVSADSALKFFSAKSPIVLWLGFRNLISPDISYGNIVRAIQKCGMPSGTCIKKSTNNWTGSSRQAPGRMCMSFRTLVFRIKLRRQDC